MPEKAHALPVRHATGSATTDQGGPWQGPAAPVPLCGNRLRVCSAGEAHQPDAERAAAVGCTRDAIAHLATAQFIPNPDVVLLGPPGTGKTHLSIGLGIAAAPTPRGPALGVSPRLAPRTRPCRPTTAPDQPREPKRPPTRHPAR
ncbi:ATP-binding protein [Prauserella endophytica]|uniref:IstB-like ATP-binding domain-containing protein n=1 Tax=Prauserella endophytica TaxID=1592324 RepID=A0ABY2RSG3_9PSEU|nr:ATP-binding protein [Prauserella endophytica]TKG58396.1 hypothetical protein FCN18_38070 [Prauserella endophytica]